MFKSSYGEIIDTIANNTEVNVITWSYIFYFIFSKTTMLIVNKNEKMDDAKRYASYVTSFIHSVLACIYSLLSIAEIISFGNIYELETTSTIYKIFAPMTTGYFLQDLTYLYSGYNNNNKKETFMYVVHHTVFMVTDYYIIKRETCHGVASILTLLELSTIILNVYQYFRYWTKYYNGYRHCNLCSTYGEGEYCSNHQSNNGRIALMYNIYSQRIFNIFAFVFFVVRIVLPFGIYYYFFDQFISQKKIFLLSIVTFTVLLNSWWFYMIVRMVINYRFIKPYQSLHSKLKEKNLSK